MKNLLIKISSINLLIFLFSGCVGTNPEISIDKNRIPLNVNQVAQLNICGGSKEYVYNLVGKPIDIKNYGNDTYWTYPVQDEMLKNNTIIVVKIGYETGVTLNQKINDLPFKTDDLDRDRYYYLMNNIKDSKCGVKYLGTYASYEEKRENENEKIYSKQNEQKYKDELFNLKQKLIKERGYLPQWFNIKL